MVLFTTFLVGLTAAILFFYWESIGIQSGLRERSLQEQARELLGTLSAQHSQAGSFTPSLPANPAYTEPGTAYGYTLYDAHGNVRAISPSRAGKGPLPLALIPPRNEEFGPVFFAGPTRTATMTTRTPNDSFLVVSRDDPDPTTLAGSLIEQDATPLIVLAPFVLLALALIVVVINKMLRPLQRASSEASRIGPASSLARVTSHGLPSELIPLVAAFNGALDRLDKAYQFEKRLTADAAHELRTPLAVLRMRLESTHLSGGVLLDWMAVQRDFAQIDRLIAQLLDLARKEQGGTVDPKPDVNLARIAREAAALILPLVESSGRSLDVVALDPVVIASGEEDDLRDLVRNLIENALTHGKGSITVVVEGTGGRHRGHAKITVTDEGPGVPKAARALVFERFRKIDASTPGAGLGLAIVQHVAESHGGTAEFLAGPACRIQITVPLSKSAVSS